MLQAKLQKATSLISRVEDNKQAENDHKHLAAKNNKFFDSLEDLTASVESYILAKEYFGFILPDDQARLLKSLMQFAAETFESMTVRTPDKFKDDVARSTKALISLWNEFIEEYNSEMDEGLKVLSPISDSPSNINALRQNLKKCSAWPLTQENIDKYLSSRATAEQLLKSMELDDEIRGFLEKISKREATLSDLTSTILDWIKKEELSERIILTIR